MVVMHRRSRSDLPVSLLTSPQPSHINGNPCQVKSCNPFVVELGIIASISRGLEYRNIMRRCVVGYFDLYSKRQKELRGEVPDVYTYDEIPDPLRVQIVHIWHETIGGAKDASMDRIQVRNAYDLIVEILRHEYGLRKLPGIRNESVYWNPMEELEDFFTTESDPERVLSVIELSIRVIDKETRRSSYVGRYNASELADKAIDELNYRFKEYGLGYQFINGKIIRIDSELIHTDIVNQALVLLHSKDFAGAQEEFLKAHEHYRHGDNEEALNECLKAFESTMKVICDKRQWTYDPMASCRDLIKLCLEKEILPTFWLSHFNALRALLESGVPTGRNKLSGHGQGSTPRDVPPYLVGYMLHMTASAIVFLVEAEQHLP